MVWPIVIFLVKLAVVMAASYLIQKSMGSGSSGVTSAGEVQVPTAREGGSIPVVFGTCWVGNQNVVWYGDVKTQPIKASGGK
jgi:hypothetical protein